MFLQYFGTGCFTTPKLIQNSELIQNSDRIPQGIPMQNLAEEEIRKEEGKVRPTRNKKCRRQKGEIQFGGVTPSPSATGPLDNGSGYSAVRFGGAYGNEAGDGKVPPPKGQGLRPQAKAGAKKRNLVKTKKL